MAPFLTVKEAAALAGKSPSSIRRIIYPIIHDDAHPDRAHVQPTVDEAMHLRVKGENFAWRLSEELLRREMPVEDSPANATGPSPSPKLVAHADSDLIAMLRRELEIKNQQIAQQAELFAKQMELINGLGERLREGNVLIGSLQQRLALTDGRHNTSPSHVPPKPKRAPSPPAEKGGSIAPKTSKPKKSLFSRIFG